MMQRETTPHAQDALPERLAWLPLPVLFVGIVGLWIAATVTSYESQFLLVLSNFLFTGLVSLCIACLAGRSFLLSGQLRLSVRDNGKGLPDGLDWKQARSLGLRLVQMLFGQLRAAVEVSSDGGTSFTITLEGLDQ